MIFYLPFFYKSSAVSILFKSSASASCLSRPWPQQLGRPPLHFHFLSLHLFFQSFFPTFFWPPLHFHFLSIHLFFQTFFSYFFLTSTTWETTITFSFPLSSPFLSILFPTFFFWPQQLQKPTLHFHFLSFCFHLLFPSFPFCLFWPQHLWRPPLQNHFFDFYAFGFLSFSFSVLTFFVPR